MVASYNNRVRTAVLAGAIATELARAAHHVAEQGQVAAAEALLEQARHNRILALRLHAEADAEQYLKTIGVAGSDGRFVS
ncbi:hypothetical protein [Methylobacterium sp. CM6257]|jgi:hypothetical protein